MTNDPIPTAAEANPPAPSTHGETTRPRVFIGMPVFNGCPYIEHALQSLTKQAFRDWRLLIADNCSTDETADVCKRFVDADSRITYVKHDKNQGAGFNFRYVLEAADSEFFMWAAADDVWDVEFLQTMVVLLAGNAAAGAAFCEIDNVDSFGQCVRTYPSFTSFSSPPESLRDAVSNYLWAAEYMGKANLFYALYRRSALEAPTKDLLYETHWGLDMAMVLSVMTRHSYMIADRVLFHKRLVRPTDTVGSPLPITAPLSNSYRITREMIPGYFSAIWNATSGSPFFWTSVRVMLTRVVGTFLALPIRIAISLFSRFLPH